MKILLAIITFISLSSCTTSTPCSGQKIGRIVKIADEGVFRTTCEGELIRGGLVDGSGSMGTSFKFTIEDVRLRDIAYHAFENQQEVILSYECELFSFILRSQSCTPHFVKKIEIVR